MHNCRSFVCVRAYVRLRVVTLNKHFCVGKRRLRSYGEIEETLKSPRNWGVRRRERGGQRCNVLAFTCGYWFFGGSGPVSGKGTGWSPLIVKKLGVGLRSEMQFRRPTSASASRHGNVWLMGRTGSPGPTTNTCRIHARTWVFFFWRTNIFL